MFIVIAYDISDNRRRTRLHKELKRFGVSVQRSVTECWLAPREVELVKKAVYSIVDEKVDQVRFYYLCEACYPRLEATRASQLTSDRTVIVA